MAGHSSEGLTPLKLAKEGDGLCIEWGDGHRSIYTWKHLRAKCPCAACRDDQMKPVDPFRILKPSEMVKSAPVAPVSMTPVGRYAYKIIWNDGHDTGLYTLEDLRSLCECPECKKD